MRFTFAAGKIVLAIALFFLCTPGSAQNQSVTSIDQLLEQAGRLSTSKPDSALFYFARIKKRLPKLKNEKTKIRFFISYANYFNHLNNYDSALFYLNKALVRCQGVDSLKKLEAITYSFMAEVYQHSLRADQALEYQLRCIKISTELKDPERFIDYNNLGSIYQDLGEDSLAIQSFEKALDLSPPNHKLFIVSLNTSLFLLYDDKRDWEKCRQAQMAMEPWLNDPEVFDLRTKIAWYLNQSRYYLRVDSLDKAEAMLNIARPLTDSLNLAEMDLYLSTYESDYFIARNDYKRAFAANERYHMLSDSLDGVEVQNNLNALQTKYETAEKERLISEQSLILEKNEARQLAMLIIILGILSITGLLIYFYLNSRKKRKLLQTKNIQIQEAHAEIENLMRESHHRIKNNLQVVSSLLKMQSKNVGSAQGKDALLEAYHRIQTIAMLHQKLQGSQSFKTVNTKEFIEQLLEAIKKSLLTDDSLISFVQNIEPAEISTDVAISLGLMINELVTNAIKYAFDKDVKGKVEIELQISKDHLHLKISDTGKGFPLDFTFETLNSLGYKIVRSMATKLKADVYTKNEHGAVIEINIPYERAA
jgi:two-component sensor histidine kinase/Tfp pilus assembly protein PilF